MAHVVFIHGLSNKPPADYLLPLWKRKLAHADGLDLDTVGVGARMVYWADVLYPEPDRDLAAYESGVDGTEVLGECAPATALDPGRLPANQRDLVERLNRRYAVTDEDLDPATMSAEERREVQLERVPLPPGLRNRLMKILVRDAHYYFFNVEHSPRAGTTYRVRDELRRRFVQALAAVPAEEGPVTVVSHSMGTIIAYDCLRNVPECPRVDTLLTIGSPLGLDEVQDFVAERSRRDRFPSAKLGRWINVFDRLDAVAAADPELANDFPDRGTPVIDDLEEPTWGAWRHSISKYFQGHKLRQRIASSVGGPGS